MSELRCTRTIDIGAYLLGGLGQDEAVALRNHIDGCASCSSALRELQPLTDQLRSSDLRTFAGVPVDVPPPDLRDRILERASTEAAVVGIRSRRLKTAAAAVALFAAGSGVGWSARPAAAPEVTPPTTRSVYWGTGKETAPQKVVLTKSETGPSAWASVSSGPAGTYAALYTKGLEPNQTYSWWFETVAGDRVPLGTFVFPEHQYDWVVCPGGTSIERVKLAAIGATNADGQDVLRADLPNPSTPS